MRKSTTSPPVNPDDLRALKNAGITTERLGALYIMGKLDLLKPYLSSSGDATITQLRAILAPKQACYERYRWVYDLALESFFGEYDLETLMYSRAGATALIDRVLVATAGTEETALHYLGMHLSRTQREILEQSFRLHLSVPEIARRRRVTSSCVRQSLVKSMEKIRDEDAGITYDLMRLVFIPEETEDSCITA